MSDQLKREWREIQLPQEVCRAARDRAWRRISREPQPAFWLKWGPVGAGALACLILAAVVLPRLGEWRSTPPRSAEQPAARNSPRQESQAQSFEDAHPAPQAAPALKIGGATRTPAAPARRVAATLGKPSASRPRQEKLVVNLTLPDTGVRMIWILDENFGKTTEARND